jgi:branched-subunit amino acid ABC-type transport system permease component
MAWARLDLLIGGLAMGGVYSLVALGFAMIIRATGILHFAQGEVLMIGAMVGLFASMMLPVPMPVVLVVGMLASAVLAAALEFFVYRTLRERGVPNMNIVTATLGVSITLANAARLMWGAEPIRYPDLFSTAGYQIGAVRIAPQLLWIMILSVLLMGLLQAFLRWTRTGIMMRAVAQDPQAAQLMGANLVRSRVMTFAVGGALAGAAGVMLGSMFYAYFEMGFVTGIKGFVAATLGGLGSIGGAMAGGILFGLIETYGAVFISSAYKDAIGMGLLILILLAFPSGLAGMLRGRS